MSLKDIGKYDVSEETQAFKDKLASQGAFSRWRCIQLLTFGPDTENAGLRNRLMKREEELEEIKASLNETLHKVFWLSPT